MARLDIEEEYHGLPQNASNRSVIPVSSEAKQANTTAREEIRGLFILYNPLTYKSL
jgi:hypothetical protein